MTLGTPNALDRWQEVVTNVKRHIFNKRQQHLTYVNIRENLGEIELLINLVHIAQKIFPLNTMTKTFTSKLLSQSSIEQDYQLKNVKKISL